MKKLLDKPIEVLKSALDLKTINPLNFIGDVLGEFYVKVHESKGSYKKFKNYMVKIEELLEYAGKRNDVSNYRRTYNQLLEEFGLNLEDRLDSEERLPMKKVSVRGKYKKKMNISYILNL